MNYRTLKSKLIEEAQASKPDVIGVVEVREDLYDLIPESTVMGLVKKHHPNAKITNTLLENCLSAAKSQRLTTDKAVLELRRMNPADAVFESHVEYRLNDGRVMVISEEMNGRLNKILGEHPIILDFMRESTENFMDVVNELED